MLQCLLLLAVVAKGSSQGLDGAPVPCQGACPDAVLRHYDAKGCQPVFDDAVSLCCPVSYDCSAAVRDPSKCYYKGVAYDDGQEMPIENPCERGCTCSTTGGWPEAQCAQVECPSLFNPSLLRCDQVHSIDSCCPTLSNCPDDPAPSPDTAPAVIRSTAACTVDGKEYDIGAKMYPDTDNCQVCVCTENFTDIYGVGCRTIDCGAEYRDRRELEEGCTPIFFDGRCCHIDWICPGSTKLGTQTEVEAVPEGTDTTSTHCTLGAVVLPLNATLVTVPEDLNCFCVTPPDFTCIQYPSAQEAKEALETGVRAP